MEQLKKGDLVLMEKREKGDHRKPETWIDKEKGVGIVLKVYKSIIEVEYAEVYWQKGQRYTRVGSANPEDNGLIIKHKEEVRLIHLWKIVGRSGKQWDLVPCGGNGELSNESILSVRM